MLPRNLSRILSFACSVAFVMATTRCEGHFLWIKTVTVDGKPQALLFFNESPSDESYHFPEKLSKTKLWSRAADGKQTEVTTNGIDTEDRVGLIGPISDPETPVLQTTQQYGIYGRSLLFYHAKHVRGTTADELNAAGASKELKLEVVPKLKEGDVELTVLWDGKPLAGADVTVFAGDKDPVELKTGDGGHASFKPEGGGLVGVLANTMEQEKAGELDGKPYKGVMHYATLTFNLPAKATPAAPASVSVIAPLPEPVASFGAVVSDGWLYVYGGHTGEEHEHSAANLSKHFRRIKLDGASTWQELPMQTPLQGLPLVAHAGKIYRVGGLDIRNPTTKDTADLHSTAEFSEFDPAPNKWTALRLCPRHDRRTTRP